MPPKQSKRTPAKDKPAAPKGKVTVPKEKRERSFSALSTHTFWHGVGNAFKPGF
jgi:hypothetical protein